MWTIDYLSYFLPLNRLNLILIYGETFYSFEQKKEAHSYFESRTRKCDAFLRYLTRYVQTGGRLRTCGCSDFPRLIEPATESWYVNFSIWDPEIKLYFKEDTFHEMKPNYLTADNIESVCKQMSFVKFCNVVSLSFVFHSTFPQKSNQKERAARGVTRITDQFVSLPYVEDFVDSGLWKTRRFCLKIKSDK